MKSTETVFQDKVEDLKSRTFPSWYENPANPEEKQICYSEAEVPEGWCRPGEEGSVAAAEVREKAKAKFEATAEKKAQKAAEAAQKAAEAAEAEAKAAAEKAAAEATEAAAAAAAEARTISDAEARLNDIAGEELSREQIKEALVDNEVDFEPNASSEELAETLLKVLESDDDDSSDDN